MTNNMGTIFLQIVGHVHIDKGVYVQIQVHVLIYENIVFHSPQSPLLIRDHFVVMMVVVSPVEFQSLLC